MNSISTDINTYEDFLSDEYDEVRTTDIKDDSSILSKLKNIASISEVLRIFGACAVIASMSLFLLNGWSEGNDIQRYLKLLTQTGLLTAAGIGLSLILKENKGARLFFGLSLVSVVANFMILGALTYSMYQLDSNLIDYPSMVTWSAVSASTFWPVFAGAVILLAVLTRFSFSIFARSIAGPLTLNFLAMNALFLIPVRSSIAVSIIAIAALWVSALQVKKLSQNEKVVFTNETKFAMCLMFAPGLLIFARALSLYSIDEVMLTTLAGLLYFSLRSWLQRLTQPSLLQGSLEKILFLVGIFLAIQITSLVPSLFSDVSGIIFSAIIIALTFDQIKGSGDQWWQKSILNISTLGLVIFNIGLALLSDNIIIQTGSLLVNIGLFFFASQMALLPNENRFSKITSIIGIIASLLIIAAHIIALINLGNWVVIGLTGVALIIGGSLYERFGLSFYSLKK